MAVLAMTLPLARRSHIRIPRRDLAVGDGDRAVLRVSLAEADRHDAPLVNLRTAFARVRMHIWQDAGPLGSGRDYGLDWRGPELSTRSAMATDARPMSVDIEVSLDATRRWGGSGRLGWSLQAALWGDEHALCWGALHLRPGLDMPPLYVLTGEGEKTLTGAGEGVVV